MSRTRHLVQPELVPGSVAVSPSNGRAASAHVGRPRSELRLEPLDVALRLDVHDRRADGTIAAVSKRGSAVVPEASGVKLPEWAAGK